MIDFHNHVLPGVDDGAADLPEALAALEAFAAQGVDTVVATPHLSGADTLHPAALERALARVDAAWEELGRAAARALPGVRLARGAEVMLDVPTPDLSDPRVRLAGTRFVLVEFPFMAVPPHAAGALLGLREAGWHPVLAHPERYVNAAVSLADAAEWRRAGAALQVNAGSLLGRYGEGPRRIAWGLVERGWADYLCSDFHARGRCATAEAAAALLRAGGEPQARRLTVENPARLLADRPPLPVAPLRPRAPLWRRVFRPGRG
ncbi:MAG TPA: CpsB/CapC family capsule biosynthesis tyrosine phosphatase [Longimicrobium sp.]|jgi:protein-tyrosine phosphatase|nr:CpsB/CapC family capsule biosynthesis tyrosine phosphatase [Longimicrobium sp.]